MGAVVDHRSSLLVAHSVGRRCWRHCRRMSSNVVCETREGVGGLSHSITVCLKVMRHVLPLVIADRGSLLLRSAHELAYLVNEDLAGSRLDIEWGQPTHISVERRDHRVTGIMSGA